MDNLHRIAGFPIENPQQWESVLAGGPCFQRVVKDSDGNLKKAEMISIAGPQSYKQTAFLDTNIVYEVRNNLATGKKIIKRYDLNRDIFDKNGGIFSNGNGSKEYKKLTKDEFKKIKGKSLAEVASEFIDKKGTIQQQLDDLINLAKDTKNFTRRVRWIK